jgi:hypothetical protein
MSSLWRQEQVLPLVIAAALVACVSLQTSAQGLSVNDFYPRGPRFPCSAYSVGAVDGDIASYQPADRQRDIDAAYGMGVEILGPQYELNEQVLSDARRARMGAIYSVGIPTDFETWKATPDDVEAVYQKIVKQVSRVADDAAIVQWYLSNEELRHWRPVEMAFLEAAARAVRDADPLGRPLVMYEPGHRDSGSLALTGKYLGAISMGVYPNYGGYSNRRAWVAVAVAEEKKAAVSLGGRPVIFVPEMFADPPDERLLERWVTHDVLRALVEGATGVSVFSLRRRGKFSSYERYRAAYSGVLKLICGSAPLGQAVLHGTTLPEFRVYVSKPPDDIEFESFGQRYRAKGLGFAAWAYEGRKFAVIANSTDTDVEVFLELPESVDVELASGVSSDGDRRRWRFQAWGAIVVEW